MTYTVCEDCAKRFLAKSKAKRRCPKCDKKHVAAMQKKYKQRTYGREKETGIEKQWRKWFKKPLVLEDEMPRLPPHWEQTHYCAGYDPENLSCILCYENQTAPYKGCYKK